MAALEDFYRVPQLKHLFVKDGATGAKGFFDFDGVVSRLDSIEYDLSRIKGDIIAINEVGDNLEAALAEVTAALTEIKDIREELLAQFAALEQSTKEGLDAANGRIDALNAALGAAVNRITALEGVTAQLTARLDNLTADVTKLQSDVTKLRADLTKTQGDLAQLRSDLEDLGKEVEAVKQDLLDNYAKLASPNVFSAQNDFTAKLTCAQEPRTELDVTNKSYVDAECKKAYLPVGSIIAFAGVNPPDGYLLCDGAAVEKQGFPELYAVIGDTYGATDLTFNLPDLRDRFIQGGTEPSPRTQDASLPNIRGNFTGFGTPDLYHDGAFTCTGLASDAVSGITEGNARRMLFVNFDASAYSSYYKDGTSKVVPPSYVMLYLIKV